MPFVTSRQIILILFLIAALSLVLAGVLVNPQPDGLQVLVLSYMALNGTWLLYGFDYRAPLASPFQRFFLIQCILLGVPLGLAFCSDFQLLVLSSVAILSAFYQVEWRIMKPGFRPKQLFLVKNTVIGISWGALCLLGAGNSPTPAHYFLFSFASVQIAFGSILRDISDVEHDRLHGAQTMPVRFGIQNTIRYMHLVNGLSLLCALPFGELGIWVPILSLLIVIWKAFIMLRVQQNHEVKLWTQYLNILTCSLILLLVYFLR